MDEDLYEILGVSRDADAGAIKSAFRRKAKEYHPDRNGGDPAAETKFKQVNAAYDVLKDPQKRAAYDRFGHAAFRQDGGFGSHGGFDGSSFSDIFDDLFGEFMGGSRRSRGGGRRGGDLRYDLEVTLEEAFAGKTQEITIPTSVSCEKCDGSGAKPGSEPATCPSCNGVGKVRTTQGFFMVERTCPSCRGRGRVIKDPCEACGGQGAVRRRKTLSVKIPAGVDDGTRIRLAGEGEAGIQGAGPGDLYIFLGVKPHPLFRREGTQLACPLPISMTTAALGGEVEVPTIEGKRAKVKIPAGTQTGQHFRLKGKGMPQMGTGLYGDMVLTARVETPVNLSRRQQELMRELAELETDRTSPETSGFFAKVKEVWADLTD